MIEKWKRESIDKLLKNQCRLDRHESIEKWKRESIDMNQSTPIRSTVNLKTPVSIRSTWMDRKIKTWIDRHRFNRQPWIYRQTLESIDKPVNRSTKAVSRSTNPWVDRQTRESIEFCRSIQFLFFDPFMSIESTRVFLN